MSSIIVLKTGTSFPNIVAQFGDFDDWLMRMMGVPVQVYTVYEGDLPAEYEGISGVVLTGSHFQLRIGLPWMLATAHWVRGAVALNIPILGVCFGHQMLAYALGGQVGDNPRGAEICTTTVQLSDAAHDDLLFSGLTDDLMIHAAHYHTVLQLPPAATVLASNAVDDHHAVRFSELAWGVQFHPEMQPEVVQAYQDAFREMLPDVIEEPVYPSLWIRDRLYWSVSSPWSCRCRTKT